MKLSNRDWLKKQIKRIEETNSKFYLEIAKIRQIDPDIFNKFHHWTPLKLTFLNFTLDVCAIVANNIYSKKNYIDLFAGSGINKIKGEHNDFFIGSPFIALLNHYNKFTRFFFCEEDPDFHRALNKRISALGFKRLNLYEKNCNHQLDKILDQIQKIGHCYNFFFIDPYKLEFSWESFKKILRIRSDILLTFMSRIVWRTICTERSTGNGHLKLTEFFGGDSWKKASSEEEAIRIYVDNIIKSRDNAIVLTTQINSGKKFGYTLIFITHKTEGDNPWLNPIKEAKQQIEKNSDLAIKSILSIIKKRQTDLSQFQKGEHIKSYVYYYNYKKRKNEKGYSKKLIV